MGIKENMQEMARGYMRAAIFTDIEEWADVDNFCAYCKREALSQCARFYAENKNLCKIAVKRYKPHSDVSSGWESLGMDFWYTRNGHGVGFWDRNELKIDDIGDKLSDSARNYKEISVYEDEATNLLHFDIAGHGG